MSIFDSIKSIVGAGAPELTVTLQKTEANVNDAVKGLVTIKGGEYATEISQIELYMTVAELNKEKDSSKELDERVGKITFNDYKLEPGETITVPFQVVVPKDQRLTSAVMTNYVKVAIGISGKNASAKAEIKIS